MIVIGGTNAVLCRRADGGTLPSLGCGTLRRRRIIDRVEVLCDATRPTTTRPAGRLEPTNPAMNFTGLTVVIPTRNRASLAVNAIKSVLDQDVDRIQVIVSDNSTLDIEIHQLSKYCTSEASRRVRYIRPPKPMSMSRHWDWVMGQFLEEIDCSHVTFLTDRMVFKRGMLKEAVEAARRSPDLLLSYNLDKVIDDSKPVTLHLNPWTGQILKLDSDDLLALVSNGLLHDCLPRMLNSIVPRSIIELIHARFGNVFSSISPDFSFCFRALAALECISFFDKSVLIHYAQHRSNGQNLSQGKRSRDHLDFLKHLGSEGLNFASPVPELSTIYNAICHEYCIVRNQTKSVKFPRIDSEAYLNANAAEISRVEDANLRNEMISLLHSHGWREAERTPDHQRSLIRKLLSIRTIANKIRWLLRGRYAKGLWLISSGVLGIPPPDDQRFGFRDSEDAIDFANRFPRRRSEQSQIEALLSGLRR